jgi:hypothetical protein
MQKDNTIPEMLEVTLEHIRLHAFNFKGRAETDNAAGTRYVAVVIADDQVEKFFDEGWKIRHAVTKSQKVIPYLRVYFPAGFDIADIKLNDEALNPEMEMIEFDNVELLTGSMTIMGRRWMIPSANKSGIKAYLKSMDVKVKDEDV